MRSDPWFLPRCRLHDEVESIFAGVNAAHDWTPFHAKIEAIRGMGEAYGLGEN